MSVATTVGRGSSNLWRDLGMAARELRFEQMAFWKNRAGAAATVGFSVGYLILLGVIVGGQKASFLGSNIKLVQYYVPTFIAYAVMATCFTNLCIQLVIRRETGLLKRLRLSPLPAWVLLTAVFLSELVVVVIQIILLLAIGRVGFGVQLPPSIGFFAVTILVGTSTFTALGVAMSTAIQRLESAGPVTATLFFGLLLLSGLWFPIPATWELSKIISWLPFRALINTMFTAYQSHPTWSPALWHDLVVFAIWAMAGCVVGIWRFRWAPSRR